MATFSNGQLSIAVCSRCDRKVPYMSLRRDGDVPDLWVCQRVGCWDHKDPWRLPPRPQDAFVLTHPRPDVPLEVTPADLAYNTYDSGLVWDTPGLEWDGGVLSDE